MDDFGNKIELIVNAELDRYLAMLRNNPKVSEESIIQFCTDIVKIRKQMETLMTNVTRMGTTAIVLMCEPY